tara:strand:- start:35978 stop:36172 length:195 start_codon:yes stop_codon:yes gene_type:complete
MLNNYKCHIAFNKKKYLYIPNPLHLTIFDFNEKLEKTLYEHVFKQTLPINQAKSTKKNKTLKKY